MVSVNVRKRLADGASESSDFPKAAEHESVPKLTLRQLRRANMEGASVATSGHAAPPYVRAQAVSLAARVTCVQQSPLFWGLSPAECTEVASTARELRFGNRETIFREGDPVGSVSVLASGRVKITQLGRSGAEVILRVKGTGEVVGGLGVQPGGPHFLTAQTREPCVVLVWEARKFELLEDRFPALRRNTVRIFAERLRILEQMFLELATEQVAPRLARMLVRLLEQSALNQEHAVRIDLSREELAQMTGTTLFTVSRILCDWEQRGIIQTQRKAVLVQDPRSLVALADGIHDTV